MYVFDYDLNTDLGYILLTIEFDVDSGGVYILSVKSWQNDLLDVFDTDKIARLAFEWLKDNGEQ